jgi:hypothetical protein
MIFIQWRCFGIKRSEVLHRVRHAPGRRWCTFVLGDCACPSQNLGRPRATPAYRKFNWRNVECSEDRRKSHLGRATLGCMIFFILSGGALGLAYCKVLHGSGTRQPQVICTVVLGDCACPSQNLRRPRDIAYRKFNWQCWVFEQEPQNPGRSHAGLHGFHLSGGVRD